MRTLYLQQSTGRMDCGSVQSKKSVIDENSEDHIDTLLVLDAIAEITLEEQVEKISSDEMARKLGFDLDS